MALREPACAGRAGIGMRIFRHSDQHADRLIETKPEAFPPDVTDRFSTVTLLEDKDPVTKTFPALEAAPAPRALPAPTPGPASVPPLRPAPPPRHSRTGWVPASTPAPKPEPRRPAPIRITEPAKTAAEVAEALKAMPEIMARYPDGNIPDIFTLPCGTCHRVHTRGGTSSFRDLYAEAERAGWRKDGSGGGEWDDSGRNKFGMFGVWACPACQDQPGWWEPNPPVLAGEYLECALGRDVAAHAADGPALEAVTQALTRALRRHRYYLNASALEAVKA